MNPDSARGSPGQSLSDLLAEELAKDGRKWETLEAIIGVFGTPPRLIQPELVKTYLDSNGGNNGIFYAYAGSTIYVGVGGDEPRVYGIPRDNIVAHYQRAHLDRTIQDMPLTDLNWVPSRLTTQTLRGLQRQIPFVESKPGWKADYATPVTVGRVINFFYERAQAGVDMRNFGLGCYEHLRTRVHEDTGIELPPLKVRGSYLIEAPQK